MNKTIVSLFDESGNMLRPWAEAGFTCYAIDFINVEKTESVGEGKIVYLNRDLTVPGVKDEIRQLNPAIIFGFPPCTDLAVSGARHFAAKLARNPRVFLDAVALARTVETMGNFCGVPWMLENPVGKLATMWRKSDHIFSPFQFGGYLPEDDRHPRWPEYIVPRDAYPKKTCIWSGNGFVFPTFDEVPVAPGYSVQFHKLGGKSTKTKQIRSETPRGFAQAVFTHNLHFAM